jgi:hypothetical protein
LQYAEIDDIASTLFHWTVCHFSNSWQHIQLPFRENCQGRRSRVRLTLHPFTSQSFEYKADP